MKKAIFLDRDGTINVEKNYVHRIDQWEWIDGAKEAIRLLKQHDYLVVVITNQSGIARGYYTKKEVNQLHQWVQQELKSMKVAIDAFYHCPHHPDFTGPCECRKPAPGLVLKAIKELEIDPTLSWIIGDKISDIKSGINAGIEPILVLTGHGNNEKKLLMTDVHIQTDILAAIHHILEKKHDQKL